MNGGRVLRALPLLALMPAAALAAGSCESSEDEASTTAAQSVASPAATATPEEDIEEIIRGLVLGRIGPTFKGMTISDENVRIRDKHYYTDSSGANWIGFGAEVSFEEGSELALGVVKEPSKGMWELVSLGTGPVPDTIPDDVRIGLGLD